MAAKKPGPSKKAAKSKPPRKWWYWLGVAFVWALLAFFVFAIYLVHDLPSIDAKAPPPSEPGMVIVARDGSTLAAYGDVYGDWLTFQEFPQSLISALIATEDRRFFSHIGIDMKGILRAGLRNIMAGDVVEGGSTITQQLAKNLFLSQERTLRRKVQEVILAIWLEFRLSKEDIISLYLNRSFFGNRAYGVDAASRIYFGHDARTLSLPEAALLVGILKAPTALAPTRDYWQSVERSHEVLGSMADAGLATKEEVAIAKAQPPKVMKSLVGTDARYFTDWVVSTLPATLKASRESLVVETTLDPRVQELAERALARSLNTDGIPGNITQGAVLVMTVDGSVLAMVGGRSYSESQFNRVTQAKRQPGSAFKLFVYMAALDAGLTPDDTLRDSPVVFDGWQPENYGKTYQGEVTLGWAFADSINTVAVKLAEMVSRSRVERIAHAMGIVSPIKTHPSMALGTSEVSLLELTTAYAVVANGGYAVEADGVVEVRTSRGQVISRAAPHMTAPLVAPKAVDMMRSMLEGVILYGTGKAARLDRPAYGKTGTSQDSRDAWFIGFSGDYVVGVWLGNDNGAAMQRVTGGAAPAKLWKAIMEGLYKGDLLTPTGRPMKRPGSGQDVPEAPGFFDRLRKSLSGPDDQKG